MLDLTQLPDVPDDTDFIDPDFLLQGVPFEFFAALRYRAPVWWNAEPGNRGFTDGGFWVISRHADVRALSRDHENWSSAQNGVIMSFPEDVELASVEQQKAMIISHDPPEHTRLRKIVSRLFTPKAVAAMEQRLVERCRANVEEAVERGSGDFIADIAAKLPLEAIADLIGIPLADRDEVFRWANAAINFDDPDPTVDPITAGANLLGYAYMMAEDRRKRPADDIVTRLVHADMDGDWMTELEFGYFVIILAVAGNDTSRNATAWGLNGFLEHPDQWELYKRARPTTAADEIVRYASPVHCMQRTALHDTELHGVTIAKGQRVGLFYTSANYDETVFDNPHRLDITRNPNPHMGFGQGVHHCLGANLARLEIKTIFDAVADLAPDISKLSEPVRHRSGLLNSLKSFHVQYR